MNCNAALESMLDAGIDELKGHGETEVAVHLRGCARCNAVAVQLVSDTVMLATATAGDRARRGVARRSSSRAVPMWPWLVGAGALAAAVVLVLQPGTVVRQNVVAAPPATPAPPPIVVTPPLAPATSKPAVRRLVTRAPRAETPVAASVSLPPEKMQTFAAFTPVRLDSDVQANSAPVSATPYTIVNYADSARARVSVRPPPGMRVAVLKTSDPKITVVWLY